MVEAKSTSDMEVKRAQIQVLEVAEGFFQTSVLCTLLKLRIFEMIGDERKSETELARTLGSPVDRLRRLLNAGVALKMLEKSNDNKFVVGRPFAKVLLPSAGDDYLGD